MLVKMADLPPDADGIRKDDRIPEDAVELVVRREDHDQACGECVVNGRVAEDLRRILGDGPPPQ